MSNNKEMKDDNCKLCPSNIWPSNSDIYTFAGFVLFANMILNIWQEVQNDLKDISNIDIINKELVEVIPEVIDEVTDSEPDYDKLD